MKKRPILSMFGFALMALVPSILLAAPKAPLALQYRETYFCQADGVQIGVFDTTAPAPQQGVISVTDIKDPSRSAIVNIKSRTSDSNALTLQFADQSLVMNFNGGSPVEPTPSRWTHEVCTFQNQTLTCGDQTDSLTCQKIPPSPSGFSTGN